MTLIAAIPAPTRVLELLANSAVRALALAGAAGLGLAAFRVKSTTMRLFTWTAVLYAALAMPVLQWMLPPVPVPAPAVFQHQVRRLVDANLQSPSTDNVFLPRRHGGRLSSSTTATPSPNVNRTSTPQPETARIVAVPADTSPVLSSIPSSFLSLIPWSTFAAGVYFGVMLLLLARFCVGLAFGRRLAQASQWIDDLRVTSRIAFRAQALGLAPAPWVAESELISVPLTLGVLRSTILLPMGWPEWDDAKLDAVVAHEVSHVARRDALTQLLSLLHRAFFWFNPLAWWLDQHLADLAEQASDEAALSCGADREDYARTLLEFFEALHAAPGRVWWQGVAMAKAGQAEERLERILSWKGSVAMRLQKSIAIMVVALAVPLVYFAASVHAANQGVPLRSAIGQDQTPAPAPRPEPAPKAKVEPTPAAIAGGVGGGITGGVSGGIVSPAAPGVAPVGRMSAIAPMAPTAPMPSAGWRGQSSHSGSSSGHGYSYSYGYDDEQRFVIVSGKTDALTMSGSEEDARHVEKLRKTIPGDFIWFQRDEKSYIIRDQATIDRARKLWAPQEELGRKQEELGKQQEALGKQQEELGAKMEQVHVNVPDMTAELDKLKAELKKLSSGATMEQVGEIQSEIGELQSRIGEIQSRAGDQQGKVGELMGALGEKQGKLGEQQGELGRRQAELAQEASQQMKQLLDEAIAKGIAQLEL